MEKITRDLKVSGIYCIENKINNKTYIGSSKNLYQRLLKHFQVYVELLMALSNNVRAIGSLTNLSSYHHLKLNLTNKIPNIIIIGTALL